MSIATHQADPHNRARLRWRARRGLLENDLIITRFLDRHEETLSDDEVAALSAMLDMPDNDLMNLILGRIDLPAGFENESYHAAALRLVALLRVA